MCREEIILWHSIALEVLDLDTACMAALESERITILLKYSFSLMFFIAVYITNTSPSKFFVLLLA
jgi:hypothetical protein